MMENHFPKFKPKNSLSILNKLNLIVREQLDRLIFLIL